MFGREVIERGVSGPAPAQAAWARLPPFLPPFLFDLSSHRRGTNGSVAFFGSVHVCLA
jgi:hypothetical protein